MSKQILCFSGWGQKFDSLEVIFRESFFDPFFVSSCNYAKFENIADFFDDIAHKQNPQIVVGWSLGGQLAIRLIEKKIIAPKLLILIAPPFAMVKNCRIQTAMSQKVFTEFYQNFIAAPSKALKQFAVLTAMKDGNAKEIVKNLKIDEENFAQLKFWLEELQRFSCFDVDFSNAPRTVFFQGNKDMIVHASQAEYFAKKIKNFRLEIFENCGHAPHLNNLELLQKIIIEEINRA